MQGFTFNTVAQLIAKPHCVEDVGMTLRQLGVSTVFFVTDPMIVELGLAKSALKSLSAARVEVVLYQDVQADPPEQVVRDAVAKAKQAGVDGVIGFGGGSSMDVAKLIALLANPEQSQSLTDIYGVGKITGKRLPLVQIPTTAGTGSEVTAVAIVSAEEDAQGETTKMGVVSPVLYADVAMLDATLTLGLPAEITAVTAIDAMVHAIEAYTSKHLKNTYSDMLAVQGLSLLDSHFAHAMSQGKDIGVRHQMLLGACMAGQAFANAPVAAVHALAYPLGGFYHLSHGLTNSLVLLEVLRFNMADADAESLYADLYRALDPLAASKLTTDASCAKALLVRLQQHIHTGGFKTRLRDYDIPRKDLSKLAGAAMKQTRLLKNNPRELTEDDAFRIYEAVY